MAITFIRSRIDLLLANRIVRSIGWSSISVSASRASSLLTRLILARLIAPEDFGLIAMVMISLGFVNILVDFGLKNSLIQRERSARSVDRYSTAFWFLLAAGMGWAALFALVAAPSMAWFFEEPDLVDLARVMAISILIHAISIIPEVRLVRLMRFKQLALAEICAAIGSALIAIYVAYKGGGAWALAMLQVSMFCIRSFALWAQVRWRPRMRYRPRTLRDVRGFSGYMLGSQILQYVRLNTDNLAVGALVGASSLGLYSLAYLITETLRSQIGTVVARVMFPAYSQSANDLAKLRAMFLTVMRYMCAAIFPIATLLLLDAEAIIRVSFGAEWIGAAEPVKVLSVASAVMAINGDPSSLLKGLGQGKTIFTLHAINTLLIGVPAIMIGTYYAGATGAAYGVLIQASLHTIMMQVAVNRAVAIPIGGMMWAIVPGLGLSAIAAAASLAVRNWS
jgi:O-antigen/teichoic acid export membrane protein